KKATKRAPRIPPITIRATLVTGPRGISAGTTTLYLYLNAAREVSSSMVAASIRSSRAPYFAMAKRSSPPAVSSPGAPAARAAPGGFRGPRALRALGPPLDARPFGGQRPERGPGLVGKRAPHLQVLGLDLLLLLPQGAHLR